jgi:hypothetical protein
MDTRRLVEELFALSEQVRYVAVRIGGGDGLLRERAGLANASASESDRYEERIVNPTLLALVGERGRIDCGGVDWVLVRYGHFFQLVHPVRGGHVSVAFEPGTDVLALQPQVLAVLATFRLLEEKS